MTHNEKSQIKLKLKLLISGKASPVERFANKNMRRRVATSVSRNS